MGNIIIEYASNIKVGFSFNLAPICMYLTCCAYNRHRKSPSPFWSFSKYHKWLMKVQPMKTLKNSKMDLEIFGVCYMHSMYLIIQQIFQVCTLPPFWTYPKPSHLKEFLVNVTISQCSKIGKLQCNLLKLHFFFLDIRALCICSTVLKETPRLFKILILVLMYIFLRTCNNIYYIVLPPFWKKILSIWFGFGLFSLPFDHIDQVKWLRL